jgi:hypothetical protein
VRPADLNGRCVKRAGQEQQGREEHEAPTACWPLFEILRKHQRSL